MAESAVSFLFDKLSAWLHEHQQLLGGLEQEVQSIQDEMGQMREFLRVADANEESNPDLKEWVRQVREISYDVQDVLDRYMFQFRRPRDTNGFMGYILKVRASMKNLIPRRRMASEIQGIKYRLENVSRSHQRYREMYAAMDQGSISTISKNEGYDGRGDALLLEETDVVGIEKPKKQLLEWIWSMDNGLEVISVVGMGGLGKTTLVKKVYDDESVMRHFFRHVWIVASDYKDVKHFLQSLIKKLFEEIKELPPQGLRDMSIDEMRNFIYEFLKEKNYIIVLDDVWDMSRWEAIRFALPRRVAHGCIIISTRFNSIARAACSETDHVYNLEPLPEEESRELFYKKAFPRNPCPPYLREYGENILKRCEGLPLAIVVIGGVLATKENRAEEWERFSRSLTHEIDEGGCLKRLGKLLSLSYNDLPYYLKYCLLYLSIFPEGGLMDKHRIIRLWMAEGFVQSKQNKTMEEVADDYLCELLSRSLIQVAARDFDGRARAFRIHDLLRDYITLKSREQNMVTIYNGKEMQEPNKVRRLAIQKSINFFPETNDFEYLRSLLLLCDGSPVSVPIEELVNRCRLLKVLDLRGDPIETIPNEVFKLYHLKYLSLRNTKVKLIPKSIKYLENLETLDLKGTDVTELPTEILKLQKLRHLLGYRQQDTIAARIDYVQSFKAPCEIGSCLPSLQKLSLIDADEVNGIKMVTEIGKLTQLRGLGIAKLRSEDAKELCSSLAKLTNLRSLSIFSIEENQKLDIDVDYSISLPFLRSLCLGGCLERVPEWIPSLNGLTTLFLTWSKLREDPLNCLQDLPHLARLKIHDACLEGLHFKAHGFQKLKRLALRNILCLKWVIMEKGSMPFLGELNIWGCKLMKELPSGIEHLAHLQWVDFCNMDNGFVQRIVDEKRNNGDNWRLAHVPHVQFFKAEDRGYCSFDFAL